MGFKDLKFFLYVSEWAKKPKDLYFFLFEAEMGFKIIKIMDSEDYKFFF